jgi:hypothetical protein
MADELKEIRSEAADDRAFASAVLSTQTRTISLGVLALVWLLVSGTQQPLSSRFDCYSSPLLWVAFVCVIGLLLDFLQYVFMLIEADRALKSALAAKKASEAGYDEGDALRVLQTGCFWGKLLVTGFAALWLLTIMLSALTTPHKPAAVPPAPPATSADTPPAPLPK